MLNNQSYVWTYYCIGRYPFGICHWNATPYCRTSHHTRHTELWKKISSHRWTSLASSLYFWLHQVEEFRFNDCRVVVFYIILWNFPFIGFDLLSKEINCIRLLQQGITFVLLIRKNNPSIVYLILYFFDKLIGSFSFIIAIAFMWYISLLCDIFRSYVIKTPPQQSLVNKNVRNIPRGL